MTMVVVVVCSYNLQPNTKLQTYKVMQQIFLPTKYRTVIASIIVHSIVSQRIYVFCCFHHVSLFILCYKVSPNSADVDSRFIHLADYYQRTGTCVSD